ncbi:hypothetical protein [Sphingomonas sp. URHD0057]|uniref:hypothetical protein n=1 Tax=Sphingomonas sp. URHD0057 TaxID=1380389 RepID=UPI000AB8CF55|nr:hypothetical protein [Sphingomonas sp. URHD0057]
MNQATLRYGIPLVVLATLAALLVAMHSASQMLLTPPSGGFIGITMLICAAIAFYAAYMLAGDLPSRLARRLIVIGVMAFAFYAGGETSRGLYAINAFGNGPATVAKEPWMTINGHGSSITLTNAARRKSITLPATADAALAARPGNCVNVEVERSASGAERIAKSRGAIQATDISVC